MVPMKVFNIDVELNETTEEIQGEYQADSVATEKPLTRSLH